MKMKKLIIPISLAFLLLTSITANAYTVGSPLTKLPPAYEANAPEAGATDQGVTDTGSITVKNLVDSIGTSKIATLIFAHTGAANTTTYTLTTSDTITSNIKVWMEPGAILDGAGTLTINGPLEADSQCFGTSITVSFGAGSIYEVQAAWWGFAYGTNDAAQATINKAAILAAQASIATGGIVRLPLGSFKVDADIAPTSKGITIQGAAPAYTYGTNTFSTVLVFGAGTYGFDLVTNYATALLTTIKDLMVDGNSTLTNGIGIKGTFFVENVTVKNCVDNGVYLVDYINTTSLKRVGLHYNGTGLKAAGVNSTIFSLEDVNMRQNAVGWEFYGGVARTNNLLIESNTDIGLKIYSSAAEGRPSGILNNTWLENNAGTYQMTIDAETPGVGTSPAYLTFNRMSQKAGATQAGMNIVAAAWVDFIDLGQSGATCDIILGADSNYVVIKDSPQIGDLTDNGNRNYVERKLNSGIGGRHFSGPVSATIVDISNYKILGKTYQHLGAATADVTGAGATTIYTATNATAGIVVYSYGITSGHAFLDCVTYFPGQTPVTAFSTTIAGSPAGRTYSSVTTALQIIMATGTYDIIVTPTEIRQ